MKVLVTGAKGQLGSDVITELVSRNIECFGIDKQSVDITDETQAEKTILGFNPDVIIHCAAYTDVDKAESEKELCRKINVFGTKYVAEAAYEIGAKLIYISTDYVYNVKDNVPFTPEVDPKPVNWYGITKYNGELEVMRVLKKYFIVRTSWMFGKSGANFVNTMLRIGNERGAVSVVNDQIGSPTYTPDLAALLCDMAASDKYGIYHATNEGYCSWYDFACEIFRIADIRVNVTPVTSEQYITAAKRPKNSRLDKSKTEREFYALPYWQDALRRYFM